MLEGAVSDIEYKLLIAAKDIDIYSDDGKLKYLSSAAEIIASQDDVMIRDVYIGRLCEKYGVSRTALTTKVDELRKQKSRSRHRQEINDILRPKIAKNDVNPDRRRSLKGTSAEETMIAVLLQHPDFCELAKQDLPPHKMITPLNKRIYETILETVSSGRSLDISVFSEKLLPAELGYLVALQNSDKAGNNAKTVLKDCIKVILEEDIILNSQSNGEASIDDWADALKNMINKKSKGN